MKTSKANIGVMVTPLVKGDRVSLTFQGVSVTGKVVRVKKNGIITVDVFNHPNEDIRWVDVAPTTPIKKIL